jgi:hypothetical protein
LKASEETERRPGASVNNRAGETDTGVLWTVQQFAVLPGGPWYALHKQNDEGVQWGMTGYRHEIAAFVQKHGIKAEKLPPIAEAEYYGRLAEDAAREDPNVWGMEKLEPRN